VNLSAIARRKVSCANGFRGKRATKAEGTFLKYENAINGFLASIGNRSKLNVNQIAPLDVLRWRDGQILDGKKCEHSERPAQDRSNGFHFRSQARVYHAQSRRGGGNASQNTDTARQPFSVEQVEAILRAAEGDWRGAVMVALYSGARLQDVANMRWESVDLQNRWIAFKVGKTKQRLKLPMHDALHEFLLELPAPDSGKAFLFPSLAGKGTGGKSGLSMAFSRIMGRAHVRGEVVRERQGEKGRSVNSLSFHSFRHTLTSIMANAGVPVEVRQKFTGHASAEMNQHYTHHEIETLRAAVEKLPALRIN
jgi:integrase